MQKNQVITLILTATFLFSTAAFSQTQQEMFAKPAVIGDSLSQGFYGASVESKTQAWAYPVIAAKQAGSNVTYNVLTGPYLNGEDLLKGDCGPFCIIDSLLGGNGATHALPTHAGITGADYSDVLTKSGQCENINARKWEKDWYWKYWYHYTYRWVEVADCQTPDKYHQYGLRDAGTQMQIMEKVRPTFVFGSVGANHVLCTALSTNLSCLNEARFKSDFTEVMRRLNAIDTVKGGVIFTVPDVTAIGYLIPHTDPSGRADYSGLKAFYRPNVTDPSQVLDAGEIATIESFLTMLNSELTAQAAASNYALLDAELLFNDIKENGRDIVSSSGYSPGTAHANWPLSGKPGLFGLDGVHPSRYGHAVLANELINAINAKYGYQIQTVDEYTAWYYDSLNRSPIDLQAIIDNPLVSEIISYALEIF